MSICHCVKNSKYSFSPYRVARRQIISAEGDTNSSVDGVRNILNSYIENSGAPVQVRGGVHPGDVTLIVQRFLDDYPLWSECVPKLNDDTLCQKLLE